MALFLEGLGMKRETETEYKGGDGHSYSFFASLSTGLATKVIGDEELVKTSRTGEQ